MKEAQISTDGTESATELARFIHGVVKQIIWDTWDIEPYSLRVIARKPDKPFLSVIPMQSLPPIKLNADFLIDTVEIFGGPFYQALKNIDKNIVITSRLDRLPWVASTRRYEGFITIKVRDEWHFEMGAPEDREVLTTGFFVKTYPPQTDNVTAQGQNIPDVPPIDVDILRRVKQGLNWDRMLEVATYILAKELALGEVDVTIQGSYAAHLLVRRYFEKCPLPSADYSISIRRKEGFTHKEKEAAVGLIAQHLKQMVWVENAVASDSAILIKIKP
jgi:hypothetical protein